MGLEKGPLVPQKTNSQANVYTWKGEGTSYNNTTDSTFTRTATVLNDLQVLTAGNSVVEALQASAVKSNSRSWI